jgi:pimeloyl-ACP methyl ester carboxylesterase
MRFTQEAMWAEVSALNLVSMVPRLSMPVFFFLGRHDRIIAAETSAAYFEALTAPSKKLVWFEDSAHEPAWEEPVKFDQAMLELVRPLSVEHVEHPSTDSNRP